MVVAQVAALVQEGINTPRGAMQELVVITNRFCLTLHIDFLIPFCMGLFKYITPGGEGLQKLEERGMMSHHLAYYWADP